jgi:hypothetical protein
MASDDKKAKTNPVQNNEALSLLERASELHVKAGSPVHW